MHIQNSRLLLNFNYTYSPYNLFPYEAYFIRELSIFDTRKLEPEKN